MSNVWLLAIVVFVLALFASTMAIAAGLWPFGFDIYPAPAPSAAIITVAPPKKPATTVSKPWCNQGKVVGGFCLID